LHLKNDVFSYEYDEKETGKTETVTSILNENDPVFLQIRHLHIQQAQSYIVTQIKAFQEETARLKASGDVTKLARAMPHYLLTKSKYSMHHRLIKKCLDAYPTLQKIIMCEQIIATGVDPQGKKISKPDDFMQLLGDRQSQVSDRLRLLMVLYASDPHFLNERQNFEAGFDQQQMSILNEFCRLVQLATRQAQRRAPQEVPKWATTRYFSFIHDCFQELVDGKLDQKAYPFLNPNEATTQTFGGVAGSKRRSCVPGFGQTTAAAGAKGLLAPYMYIFVAGGITHAEIREAHLLSLDLGRELILGSTHIIDPLSFLEQIGGLPTSAQNQAYESSFIR